MGLVRGLLFMCLVLSASLSFAAEQDARFQIRVYQVEGEQLTVHEAMRLALPTLWARVVPRQGLKAASRLKGRTSLVLQFKKVNRGALLMFNPVQVQSYLEGFGIVMIPVRPKWDLGITVQGFGDADNNVAANLMDYSYNIADKAGFELDSRGRRLHLSFSQVVGSDGEAMVHLDISGDFSSELLSQADQRLQGYLSYQLQSWVEQVLYEIRDAYSFGKFDFEEVLTDVLVSVAGELPLASQVSLEQMLAAEALVAAVVPVLLQKENQLYRVVLRNSDDGWLESWFSSYGMTAVRQPEGSETQWLVQ